MLMALGVNPGWLFSLIFALGGGLAGLAGGLAGMVLAVQVGMGEEILISSFVVIVIGGIGSVRGAFAGALLVGLTDTCGRAFLPALLASILEPEAARATAGAIASMAMYLGMAALLVLRPRGLFPAGGGDR
jgi:branched-chain amino acid transport system permease protein